MIEKIKGFYATHGQASWNTILIALLVLEFVVFGMANDRWL